MSQYNVGKMEKVRFEEAWTNGKGVIAARNEAGGINVYINCDGFSLGGVPIPLLQEITVDAKLSILEQLRDEK